MSRIGKLPITIPESVQVNITPNGKVQVTGPKGMLQIDIPKDIGAEKTGDQLIFKAENEDMSHLTGLVRTLTANAIKGVVEGWFKVVELSGTGYRAGLAGNQLQLALGLSHPVNIDAPEGIDLEVKENKITVRGRDKGLVGQIAATIRNLRPADPYKAKGFKYEGEIIIKKAGKAAKVGVTK